MLFSVKQLLQVWRGGGAPTNLKKTKCRAGHDLKSFKTTAFLIFSCTHTVQLLRQTGKRSGSPGIDSARLGIDSWAS
jgi:hypothetical protein